MDVIIYQQAGSGVSIVYPSPGVPAIMAVSAVPPGVPFWIVPASSVPSDRAHRDAWELDPEVMGLPTGVGGGE
jgi:hypothetical protein